jgi:hypothetical protein
MIMYVCEKEPKCKGINSASMFPLTADEAKLLYDELRTHTFSQHHPMYLYAYPLLSRIQAFIERNQDELRICR